VGPNIIKREKKVVPIEKEKEETHGPVLLSGIKEVVAEELGPWMMYLYAMKSPATKEKYVMRLGRFLDFVNQQEANKDSTLEEKARQNLERNAQIREN
jgi:hypothetical protein